MKGQRRLAAVVAGVAVAVLAVGGAAIARGVGGDEEQLTGPTATNAARAAVKAAGGGAVLEVERQDGDGAGAYEVEVRRPDGTTVEIHLDAQFRPLGSVLDQDGRAGDDSNEDEPDGDR